MTDKEREDFLLEEEGEDLFTEGGPSPEERERELRRNLTGKTPGSAQESWLEAGDLEKEEPIGRSAGKPLEMGRPRRKGSRGGGPPVSRLLLLVLLLAAAGAAVYFLVLAPPGPEPGPAPVRVVRKPEPVTIPAAPAAVPGEQDAEPAPAAPPAAAPEQASQAPPAQEPPAEPTAESPPTVAEGEPSPIAVAAPPAAAVDGYVVRAGAFLDPLNRDAVLATLRDLGLEPETRQVTGKARMIRLREGSYAPEAARLRLAELAAVVPGAFVLRKGDRLVLYAGSFRSPEKARETATDLAAAGIRVTEEPAEVEVPLDLVRVGPFTDRAAAEAAASRIREAGLEAELAVFR